MRSILVALYQLQAEEILIIGHHGCGMTGLEHETLLEKAKARGVDLDVIEPSTKNPPNRGPIIFALVETLLTSP